jgi:hypothetical protein
MIILNLESLRFLYYLIHEKYTVYTYVSSLRDAFVCQYWIRPLLLVQVYTEQKG